MSAGCEPTRTCESYTFEVLPALSPPAGPRGSPSGPAGGVQACMDELTAVLPPPPDPVTSPRAQLAAWCRSARTGLRDLLTKHPGDRCDLPAQLAAIACPDPAAFPTDEAYRPVFLDIQAQLAGIAIEHLRACVCSAMLPACPKPSHDPRVPLATITVQAGDCQVIRVCNWDVRKFIGIPSLSLQRLADQPLTRLVERLRQLCCGATAADVTDQLRDTLGDLGVRSDLASELLDLSGDGR